MFIHILLIALLAGILTMLILNCLKAIKNKHLPRRQWLLATLLQIVLLAFGVFAASPGRLIHMSAEATSIWILFIGASINFCAGNAWPKDPAKS